MIKLTECTQTVNTKAVKSKLTSIFSVILAIDDDHRVS